MGTSGADAIDFDPKDGNMLSDFKCVLGRSFVIAAAATLASLSAVTGQSQIVWSTTDAFSDGYQSNAVRPCSVGPVVNGEAADDFNVVGTIEQISVDGQQCQGCFNLREHLVGVFVRFYEWTPNGPGRLQAEYFVSEDDPNLLPHESCCLNTLTVILSEPFPATGLHYCSMQPLMDGPGSWEISEVNFNATMAEETYHRTDNGAWQAWSIIDGGPPVDLAFQLVGAVSDDPSPEIFSTTPAITNPSGRIRIDGVGFGDEQGALEIAVGGNEALVTQWTENTIIAYVPETTTAGDVDIEIILDQQVLANAEITVQPRVQKGQVKWRFAVDADFTLHRPGVGPDGSIYVNDYNHGRLYKLSPEGGLEWVVDALRGQVGLGGEGPVVIGDDGTVYVAVNPLGPTTDIVAYDSAGDLLWVFVEPNAFGVAVGPAIGPDGNLYVAFHDQDQQSFGLTSFTPDGTLRWNNNGSPPLYEHGGLGAELVFGSSVPGSKTDQVVLTVDRDDDPYLYAFDMTDGGQNWNVPRGVSEDPFLQFQIQPETGPDGTIYMTEFTGLSGLGWGLKAFDPSNGAELWRFDPDIAAGASGPEVGSDGIIYFSWDISRVTAVFPDGTLKWTHEDFSGIRTQPTIAPDNSVVMVGGGEFGESGTVKAIDAQTGTERWKVDFPDENFGNIVPDARPLITADSSTAYVPTVILADPGPFQYCYLYALDVANAAIILGDVNLDGIVNLLDVSPFINLLTVGQFQAEADINGDGVVDLLDVAPFVELLTGS